MPKSKKVLAPVESSNKARSENKTAPHWPPIQHVLPAADLALTTLLEDQILTIPNLWTSTLCKKYVDFLSTLPLTTTPGVPKRGHAVRVNDRFQVDDAAFAERLWTGTALEQLVLNATIDGELLSEDERTNLWGGEILGLNSNIRCYRYTKGQFFDRHCKQKARIFKRGFSMHLYCPH